MAAAAAAAAAVLLVRTDIASHAAITAPCLFLHPWRLRFASSFVAFCDMMMMGHSRAAAGRGRQCIALSNRRSTRRLGEPFWVGNSWSSCGCMPVVVMVMSYRTGGG